MFGHGVDAFYSCDDEAHGEWCHDEAYQHGHLSTMNSHPKELGIWAAISNVKRAWRNGKGEGKGKAKGARDVRTPLILH